MLVLLLLVACNTSEKNPSDTINQLAILVEEQKANQIPFDVYKFNPEQASDANIDSENLSETLGEGNAVEEITVYVSLGEADQPIIIRNIAFENGKTYALFEAKDGEPNTQFIPYESHSGFLADTGDEKLTFVRFIMVEKEGETLPVPFFEVKSNIKTNTLDPIILEKANAGDQEAFGELINIFGNQENIEKVQTSNLVTNNSIEGNIGSENWDKTLNNIVEIVTGAKPAQAATEEPIPTEEPTPTVEPMITPTEVVLNPEQQLAEYLKTDEAKESIDQFVNAMTSAGFEVTAEQVNQGLTIQESKDKNGNPVILVLSSDNFPLFIANQNKETKEWEWSTTTWRDGAKKSNISITVVGERDWGGKKDEIQTNNFSGLTLWSTCWKTSRDESENNFNFKLADGVFDLAKKNGQTVSATHLVWGYDKFLPSWLLNTNYSRDQYIGLLKNHIKTMMSHFSDYPVDWIVVNEYDENDFLGKKIGSDYAKIAFQIAREVQKEIDPNKQNIDLVLNDYQIEYTNAARTNKISKLIKELVAEGLVDKVGMEMRFVGGSNLNPNNPPKKEQIAAQIKYFRSIGVNVEITELEVDSNIINGSKEEKNKKQAEIYKMILEIAGEEQINVNLSDFYNYDDKRSFPFENDLNPNASYYYGLKGLYSPFSSFP